MISIWKYHKSILFFTFLSAFLYWVFAYDLDRTEFSKLLALYLGLFFLAYRLYRFSVPNLKTILIVGLFFRLIFVVDLPHLSQDFYRFIWDGYLNLSGINPYLWTPSELLSSNQINIPNQAELYAGMGELSASNYTNYPPLNQWLFAIGNLFPGNSILSSVIGLRILIILGELGVFWIGVKLLEQLKLPVSNIYWYFLNPFIIVELTGNLHFEGVMLFFLLLSLYLLTKKQMFWSALCFGLSVLVKLIPLMLLPLFLTYVVNSKPRFTWSRKQRHQYKKLIGFYSLIAVVVLSSFIPYFSPYLIDKYAATIGLWFHRFEFNASIYYVLRSIGYGITGYNQIAVIGGKILPIITILFIVYRSIAIDNSQIKVLISSMLFVISLYLFLSTTVHPWYLTTLVGLSMFTTFKYPMLWSVVVVLSYFAYSQVDNNENLWLLSIEYAVVFGYLLKELYWCQKQKGATLPHQRSPH